MVRNVLDRGGSGTGWLDPEVQIGLEVGGMRDGMGPVDPPDPVCLDTSLIDLVDPAQFFSF